ncbi:YihY/virulence factor BrkB family protein [Fictibacillus iocasae]|uniref:YihY/virulence factor BrkB family protein n=1 Tax=Fictibacillus iocasae TaxID=2715437 RepID=A0ABW2NQ30_9BACL
MNLFREWGKRILEDNVFDLSAQLAYYFLVSLFPFSFLVFTLLGYLPISTHYALTLFQSVAPEEAYRLLEFSLVRLLNEQRGDVLSLSLLIMIWLSSIGIHAIIRVFNHAYQIEESRPFIKELALGVLLTLGLVFAVFTALLLPVFGRILSEYVFNRTGWSHPLWDAWQAARYFISFFVLFTMFAALYKFAPYRKLSLMNVWPGALYSALGWHGISYIFSQYVTYFDYSQIYGNLGALLTLMIWFYLSAMILITGGQLNAILTMKTRSP